jgi:hypothetical protein
VGVENGGELEIGGGGNEDDDGDAGGGAEVRVAVGARVDNPKLSIKVIIRIRDRLFVLVRGRFIK